MHERIERKVKDMEESISLYGYYCENNDKIPLYSLSVMNALETMKNGLYHLPCRDEDRHWQF